MPIGKSAAPQSPDPTPTPETTNPEAVTGPTGAEAQDRCGFHCGLCGKPTDSRGSHLDDLTADHAHPLPVDLAANAQAVTEA